jgi:hypothetical protein
MKGKRGRWVDLIIKIDYFSHASEPEAELVIRDIDELPFYLRS